ncbi:MAG: ATP-grasp domain-containing protein [Syntrophobacterales bacterium]
MSRIRVAIGEQLKTCPQVITLGLRPQMADYTEQERRLLRTADMIFYPTDRYVDFFATLGKETFPSVNCYRLRGNRLKHTALLRLLNVAHPRTRVYYGRRQKRKILKEFAFPCVAKKAREAADGKQVFLINNRKQLDWYNQHFNPALIQEYVVPEKELRVLVLNCQTTFGYRRNVIRGNSVDSSSRQGTWKADDVDPEGVELAKIIARDANLSDVAVDMVFDGGRYQVLELNFLWDEADSYQAGPNRTKLIIEMIEKGEL